jgi:hypothetical protein
MRSQGIIERSGKAAPPKHTAIRRVLEEVVGSICTRFRQTAPLVTRIGRIEGVFDLPEVEAEDVSSATRMVATGRVKATLRRA